MVGGAIGDSEWRGIFFCWDLGTPENLRLDSAPLNADGGIHGLLVANKSG